MSVVIDAAYSPTGRPGIAPEKLLRTLLLQAFYSIRSERQLMEQLDFNLLFRWFVGLVMDDKVWDATVFSNHHDMAGATVLAPFFPEAIVNSVRQHVAAKRYLCAMKPEYFGCLSITSIHTLNLLGGPMTADKAAEFQNKFDQDEIVQVRLWDYEGKAAGLATPVFDHLVPLLQKLVDQHCSK